MLVYTVVINTEATMAQLFNHSLMYCATKIIQQVHIMKPQQILLMNLS